MKSIARDFLTTSTGNAPSSELVNDEHSRLNLTRMLRRIEAKNLEDLRGVVQAARDNSLQISMAGGRHSMGGQQFLTDGILVDTNKFNQILHLDRERGLVTVEAGITWTDLIRQLQDLQQEATSPWTIVQKQTGCDALSIGGSLSSNIHGRGLQMAPIVQNVENFTLLLANGEQVICDRESNRELFGLAIGGYGLFGIITSVTLRLASLHILEREVELIRSCNLIARIEDAIASGSTFGDFQFAIDSDSPDFLNLGILSTYSPTDSPIANANQKALSDDQWRELVFLAHTDKQRAFQMYSQHYLRTSGQRYRSDVFQLATYTKDYHDDLDKRSSQGGKGSEIITELYVPRKSLNTFLSSAAEILRDEHANVIYGTVRFIEEDKETFLPWASAPWACTVLNLHTEHDEAALTQTASCFRRLIDLASALGGSYYLTYHKYASGKQVLDCYPQMHAFFAKKLEYDSGELFSSNWYRHYSKLV